MKRVIVAWILCTVLSLGSFALLVLADRRLGVMLPFSLPLAFAGVSALAPALFALFESLRARRPIVVREAPPREVPAERDREPAPLTAGRRRRRTAQGVVLLDFSSYATGERAA
jgi:hypothetical protein